jgi:hypothetical protein
MANTQVGWIAAAVMTFVVLPIVILLGTVSMVVYIAIAAICLVLGANARLKNIGAEKFWESRPKDWHEATTPPAALDLAVRHS